MIWGSQYDAMINFMKRRGAESAITSTSNSLIQNNSYVTGKKETDVIKNLFDLYACHIEWTLETNSNSLRVLRGGMSGDSRSPSSRYSSDPTNPNSDCSSRQTLYVK